MHHQYREFSYLDLLLLTRGCRQADPNIGLNLTKMNRCLFVASFKRMDIGLSCARGSVKEGADALGTDSGRLDKWRQKEGSPACN